MMAETEQSFTSKDIPADAWEKVYTEDFMENMIDKYHRFLYKVVTKDILQEQAVDMKNSRKNELTITTKFKGAFKYYFSYIHCGYSVYRNIQKQTLGQKLHDQHRITIPFYGLAFRMADQIGIMLANGYTDAALRLWRTFYEYSVTLLLFLKHMDNSELANRFIEHHYRSKARCKKSYEKHGEDLLKKKLESEMLDSLNKRVAEISDEYGEDFLKEEFGWAKTFIDTKKRITFCTIEE